MAHHGEGLSRAWKRPSREMEGQEKKQAEHFSNTRCSCLIAKAIQKKWGKLNLRPGPLNNCYTSLLHTRTSGLFPAGWYGPLCTNECVGMQSLTNAPLESKPGKVPPVYWVVWEGLCVYACVHKCPSMWRAQGNFGCHSLSAILVI